MTQTGLRSVQGAGGQAADTTPLVEVAGLGVSFRLGTRREDAQSHTFRALLRRKRPEEFWALQNVNFVGSAGEIVGIVGSNGAGKSTLCRVLAQVLRPDTGTVVINGETSALLSLGTGFNTELSGRENVFLNGLMLGLSKREIVSMLPRIIDFSGLDKFIDQPLKHYSSGMKARLGFSIGSMIEPEILILDETLSAGDLEFADKAGDRLQTLMAKARLIFVVTHNLGFVKDYCTRAVWLDRGKIRAAGQADDIVVRYRASIPKKDLSATLPERPSLASRTASPHLVDVHNLSVKFMLRDWNPQRQRQVRRVPSLRRRRSPFWALDDISFALTDGEIVGVIGRNGAGKTTLCRVLTGILQPDAGQISVAGKITAFLTLGAGFIGELSGHDNIYLNGLMLGMRRQRIREVYPDIVDFSGLAEFINEPVKRFSAGMRSRLAFSIGAMVDPDILIIDEALNAGDTAFHRRATTKIQELMTRAKAVIVVTHNLPFVETVCTRALWLEKGTLRFDGVPTEAVSEYRSFRRTSGQPVRPVRKRTVRQF